MGIKKTRFQNPLELIQSFNYWTWVAATWGQECCYWADIYHSFQHWIQYLSYSKGGTYWDLCTHFCPILNDMYCARKERTQLINEPHSIGTWPVATIAVHIANARKTSNQFNYINSWHFQTFPYFYY